MSIDQSVKFIDNMSSCEAPYIVWQNAGWVLLSVVLTADLYVFLWYEDTHQHGHLLRRIFFVFRWGWAAADFSLQLLVAWFELEKAGNREEDHVHSHTSSACSLPSSHSHKHSSDEFNMDNKLKAPVILLFVLTADGLYSLLS